MAKMNFRWSPVIFVAPCKKENSSISIQSASVFIIFPPIYSHFTLNLLRKSITRLICLIKNKLFPFHRDERLWTFVKIMLHAAR